MESLTNIAVADLIDSLTEGIYVCDLDRTITYWNRAAQQITGWTPEDVVGRRCCDNVLCHWPEPRPRRTAEMVFVAFRL